MRIASIHRLIWSLGCCAFVLSSSLLIAESSDEEKDLLTNMRVGVVLLEESNVAPYQAVIFRDLLLFTGKGKCGGKNLYKFPLTPGVPIEERKVEKLFDVECVLDILLTKGGVSLRTLENGAQKLKFLQFGGKDGPRLTSYQPPQLSEMLFLLHKKEDRGELPKGSISQGLQGATYHPDSKFGVVLVQGEAKSQQALFAMTNVVESGKRTKASDLKVTSFAAGSGAQQNNEQSSSQSLGRMMPESSLVADGQGRRFLNLSGKTGTIVSLDLGLGKVLGTFGEGPGNKADWKSLPLSGQSAWRISKPVSLRGAEFGLVVLDLQEQEQRRVLSYVSPEDEKAYRIEIPKTMLRSTSSITLYKQGILVSQPDDNRIMLFTYKNPFAEEDFPTRLPDLGPMSIEQYEELVEGK